MPMDSTVLNVCVCHNADNELSHDLSMSVSIMQVRQLKAMRSWCSSAETSRFSVWERSPTQKKTVRQRQSTKIR